MIVHVQRWVSRGQQQSKPTCGHWPAALCYAQHKAAVVACFIDSLHEGRKEKDAMGAKLLNHTTATNVTDKNDLHKQYCTK